MTARNEMEAVVEAILFVSNDPVSRDKLLEVFDSGQQAEAELALEAVLERYRERSDAGFLLDEAAGGLRLVTRPDLHSYLRRFFEVSGSNKLSMPALETLAIVAYRQPVTAPEIAELRGVGSQGVLKTLLERRLVRVAGRKEVVGKPFLYATTREFLMHFGLRSLKELPPLEQFEELFSGDSEASSEGSSPDAEEIADFEAAEIEAAEDDQWQFQEEEEDRKRQEAAEAAELPIEAAEPDLDGDLQQDAEPTGDEEVESVSKDDGETEFKDPPEDHEAIPGEQVADQGSQSDSDEISQAEFASGDKGQNHEP